MGGLEALLGAQPCDRQSQRSWHAQEALLTTALREEEYHKAHNLKKKKQLHVQLYAYT